MRAEQAGRESGSAELGLDRTTPWQLQKREEEMESDSITELIEKDKYSPYKENLYGIIINESSFAVRKSKLI